MTNKYHKITGNESIGTIAEMYGTTPQTLLQSNPGMSTLAAGAFLRVPTVQTATSQGVNWNGTNPLGGAGANQPAKKGPFDNVTNALSSIGKTISGLGTQLFGNDQDKSQYRIPYMDQGSAAIGGQNSTPTNGMNAEQVAKLNLQNAANTFKPSSQLLNWNQQVSGGVKTPLTANMFQELTTISVNNGLPRDAAIQAVNSMLQAQGYVYNPITKGYAPTGATGGSAPASTNKDIRGNAVDTNNGRFSKDSWENYKQKTIAGGGKRWWIKKGQKGGGQVRRKVAIADGQNAVTTSGQADSIWRIG